MELAVPTALLFGSLRSTNYVDPCQMLFFITYKLTCVPATTVFKKKFYYYLSKYV